MKKTLLMVSFALLAFTGFAQKQDSTEMKTLFKTGKNEKCSINTLGVYFAPEFQYGQIGTSNSALHGASMMLLINKKWGIGTTMYSNRKGGNDQMNSFGGLKLEYTFKPNSVFHFTIPLVIGMGRTGDFNTIRQDNFGQGRPPRGGHSDSFDNGSMTRIIQPGIMAEANVFKYMKVFAGANYRFAFDRSGYNADMAGFTASAGLKFGVFDYKLHQKSHRRDKNKHHEGESKE